MPFDYTKYLQASPNYAPDYVTGMTENAYRRLLNNLYMYNADSVPEGWDTTPVNFVRQVVNPVRTSAGFNALAGPMASYQSDLAEFAQSYWNWLQGGATTQEQVPESKPLASNALHYVGGVGYVNESDLQKYDPRGFAAIAKQRTTEAANPAINPYWESTPGYTQQKQNVGRRPSWMPNYSSWQNFLGRTQPPSNTGGGAGAGAGGGAGVNYSAGTGNRVGNVATTSTPGQTAVTPNQWSGDYEQQARERAAKKMGRDIAQVGVTKVPNMREQYSRRVRQNFRRY